MITPQNILITPAGRRWGIDYGKEYKETNGFRKPGAKWAALKDGCKLRVGDLFGAYDDGYIRIHQVMHISDQIANARPWWRLQEYKVYYVVDLSELLFSVKFSDYCAANGYRNHSPMGRKVLRWNDHAMRNVSKIVYG